MIVLQIFAAIVLVSIFFIFAIGIYLPHDLSAFKSSPIPESPIDKFINKEVIVSKPFTWNMSSNLAFGRVRIGTESWKAQCADRRSENLKRGDKVLLLRMNSGTAEVNLI